MTAPKAEENCEELKHGLPGIEYAFEVWLVWLQGKEANLQFSDSKSDVLPISRFATNSTRAFFANALKAHRITELRSWIDQLRIRAGLAAASWQQPVGVGLPVIAAAVQELRTKLDEALLALQLTTGGYSAGLAQNLPILAVHIQEP